MITPRQALPRQWTARLGAGPIGIGDDVGTTEKKTSNPSSITVMERAGGRYVTRLVLRFKTPNEEVHKAMLRLVLDDLRDAQRKARRLCIDASSEVFFAQSVRRDFISYCPIDLVKGGASIERGAEVFSYKILLGNLYSAAFEDGLVLLPNASWLQRDHRLVLRERGTFITELGENGEHGDTFDSGKLALWALERGTGRASAEAVSVGGISTARPTRPLKNPYAHLYGRETRHRTNA